MLDYCSDFVRHMFRLYTTRFPPCLAHDLAVTSVDQIRVQCIVLDQCFDFYWPIWRLSFYFMLRLFCLSLCIDFAWLLFKFSRARFCLSLPLVMIRVFWIYGSIVLDLCFGCAWPLSRLLDWSWYVLTMLDCYHSLTYLSNFSSRIGVRFKWFWHVLTSSKFDIF